MFSYDQSLIFDLAMALYQTYKEVIVPFWAANMESEKLKFKERLYTIPVWTVDKKKRS